MPPIVIKHVELGMSSRSLICDEQGIGSFPLWKRYDQLMAILKNHVELPYQSFFSKPILENDGLTDDENFYWFTPDTVEEPQRLSHLEGAEREYYLNLKEKTILHLKQVVDGFQQEKKTNEAELLSKALKHVGDYDDLLFCFDDKVVAVVWGMRPRNVKEAASCIIERAVNPKISYTVEFAVGENGTSNIATELRKFEGAIIKDFQIPIVTALSGWNFTGWSEDPHQYKVIGDKVFVAQYEEIITIPPYIESTLESGENVNIEVEPPKQHNVRFLNRDGSIISECVVEDGQSLTMQQVPTIADTKKESFGGWNIAPLSNPIYQDTDFVAQFNPILRKGCWYYPALWWAWFKGKGCLNWLLWLLLILLLLWLFSWLFNKCSGGHTIPPPFTTHLPGVGAPNPWNPGGSMPIGADPNPIDSNPQNPGYQYLPEKPIEIVPIDSSQVTDDEDNLRKIVGNRLNVLIDDESLTITDFASDFKKAYPSAQYKIVYYDTFVKRLQLEMPSTERIKMKTELPEKLPDKYKGKIFIWDEALFESNYKPNDARISKCWYLDVIKAYDAWDISKGNEQVVVAIVDDGFSLNHEEFKGKIKSPYNVFTHSDVVYESRHKHGTHVAGTALALADNKKGISGIAPKCTLMPIQIADQRGYMTSTSVLDGVLYAVYKGADVINLSLGMCISARLPEKDQKELINKHFKEEERLWKKVFEITRKNNVTVVLAAGNDDLLAGIEPMQRSENVIVVAAVDKALNAYYGKSRFSNYGQYTTLSAPGVDIYSSVGANDYMSMDGTSMAAPIVTGAVALLKSFNKSLTPAQIKTILQETAIPVKGDVGKMIQLGPALQNAKKYPTESTDTMKMKEVIRDISSLQGTWKSSTLLYSERTKEPVTLFFRFKGSIGTMELVEQSGNKCTSPIKAWVEDKKFYIKQMESMSCIDGFKFNEYAYECYADAAGNVTTKARNQNKDQEIVEFKLIKLK